MKRIYTIEIDLDAVGEGYDEYRHVAEVLEGVLDQLNKDGVVTDRHLHLKNGLAVGRARVAKRSK